MWEGVFGFHGASDLHFQEELLILFLYFSTQEISNTLYCSRFPLWGSRVKTFLASRSTSLYWSHTRATCETKLWRASRAPTLQTGERTEDIVFTVTWEWQERERRGVTGVPVLMTGQVPQHLSLPCDLTGQNLRGHSAWGMNSFGAFAPPLNFSF